MVRSSFRGSWGHLPLVLSLGIPLAFPLAEIRAQPPAGGALPVQEASVASSVLAELGALTEALEIHAQARKKAEQSLNLAIEGAIADSAGAGNHDETRRLRTLQEILRRTHQPPEGAGPELQPAIDRYRVTMRVADRFLDGFYSEAIGVLTREKFFDEANLLAAERAARKGPPARADARPPVAHPPVGVAGEGKGSAASQGGAAVPAGRPANPASSSPLACSSPPTGPSVPTGSSVPAGAPRQMISLQAPAIEATNPSPDLEVVSAIWTADPRYYQGKASRVIATESVRRQLKGDRVIVSSAVFGEMKGLMAPKCLELTLKSEGGSPFLLRLHEGSEVVARELTSPLDKVNARPIRGTSLELMLASWGLRDEERGASVAAEYAQRFKTGRNVAASTALFGELEFGKPKVLRTLWRVGRTLLYVKQAENSEVVVEGDGAADVPVDEGPGIEAPHVSPPMIEIPKSDSPSIEIPKSDSPSIETPRAGTPSIRGPETDPPEASPPGIESPDPASSGSR